jgi:hypothetical protein
LEIENHVGDFVQVQSNDQFGVIGEMSFRNEYDGHTIDRMHDWTERIMGRRPNLIASDRGYRGRKQSDTTKIMIPDVPKQETEEAQAIPQTGRHRAYNRTPQGGPSSLP